MCCSPLRLALVACAVGSASAGAQDITLINDGKPAAQIVLPADADEIEKAAAEELNAYLKKMSGAELPVRSRPQDGVATVWLAAPDEETGRKLAQAEIPREKLHVYLESTNYTGVGPENVQFKYRTWRRLRLFDRLTPVSLTELPEGQPRSYRVVLHFAELKDVRPGDRVFDVKLQGETVLKDLDVIQEAGGPGVALVKEIKGVEARDTLTLELVPRADSPPIISAMEVHEEVPEDR